MASSSRGDDLLARIIGLLVFVLGVAIILGVLWLALQMFRDPNLGRAASTASENGPTAAEIGIGFGQLILRIALLCLGSVSGSAIANKGIHLYFNALAPKEKRDA